MMNGYKTKKTHQSALHLKAISNGKK